jgi:predicted regulator of Ras-like GTPase activity (Roadblock/LC7/MglB family)
MMVNPQMVMYEEEFNQIQTVVDRLVKDANSKVVFIVDKNGQLIAASGEVDNIDTTSLASLTAGNIAATGGIAKLLRENEFATQFHEGEKANIHIQLVGNRVPTAVRAPSQGTPLATLIDPRDTIPVRGRNFHFRRRQERSDHWA